MSSSLPHRLNPFLLAEQAGREQGIISLKTMNRLMQATAEMGEHDAYVDLWFSLRATGICLLNGKLEAQVQMICQRCLGFVLIDINRSLELALVRSEAEAALVQDEYESYQVGENDKLLVSDLIEEELLLSLPVVPAHAHRAQCDQAMLQILRRNSGEQFSGYKKSPFAVLKDLKLD